jgi:hypothetical protein
MAEPETNEPILERLAKMKVAYHELLLLGINRAREDMAFGRDGTDAVDALVAILPPEVYGELAPVFTRMRKRLNGELKYIRHYCDPAKAPTMYASTIRNYNLERLRLIIRSLDEHGLLREYRSEEVGHE